MVNVYSRFLKRFFDFILSLLALVCLSWLILLLMLAVKLDSPGAVFFTQKRVGKGRKYFNIIKFRTMRTDAPKDIPTHLFKDPEQYITRVGRFLRRYSLDELPQLFNILVGHMAVVGPRPALYNQIDLIDARDKYGANDVRPGLTGWAQVNGRDELSIEEKAKLDGEYVDRLSMLFDLRCLVRTVMVVLKKDGVVEGCTGTTDM